MFKIILIFNLLFISSLTFAQGSIKGKVTAANGEALPGVVLQWLQNPSNPVMSDEEGNFEIPKQGHQHQLALSSVGYSSDTLMVHSPDFLQITLRESAQLLDAVVIKSESSSIDRLSAHQTEIITTKALAKAACCNLSESFETNASVSVSITDAITGAKQLEMLGLSGKYIQTNVENIPNIRGLAGIFGLNFIPGTWIQSIDVSKGTSSVVNGYESMSGGINVELLKPDLADMLSLNSYVNSMGRGELNLNLAHKLNKKWSAGLLTHASGQNTEIDYNGDGFRDTPKFNQINVMNRYKYSGEKFMGQLGIKYLNENRNGGQIGFKSNAETPNLYGFTGDTRRFEMFTKTAILFPNAPYRGLGLILNYTAHNQDNSFGQNPYNGKQNTLYSNLIYQDKLGTTNHTYKAGISLLSDYYKEQYLNLQLNRNEFVPGAFLEYTYNRLDKTIVVVGNRIDFHNLFGTVYTPRINIKQDIGEKSTIRLSAGKGFRVPNPFVDAFSFLVSNRKVELVNGVSPERSWNTGAAFTRYFGKNTLTIDVYHTAFQNRQVVDFTFPGTLLLYNSDQRAVATSLQIEYKWLPADRWEVTAAYRYLNNKQTMGLSPANSVYIQKMFTSKNRGLLNIAYALPYNKWKADFTLQYNGKQRLPVATLTDQIYKESNYTYSPDFVKINSQLTRTFVKWEWYLGGENLTGFKQTNPIIGADDPFGQKFDAGMVWGPIIGRMFYLGMRYKIK